MPCDNYIEYLVRYVSRQLETMFPSFGVGDTLDFDTVLYAAKKANNCVSTVKEFRGEVFNHLNSGQYATFLYYLSHELWKKCGATELATRVFLLNKALNGIDLYYEIQMPEYFLVGHTVGMVFAKAKYGNYCVFHQGCTVGRNKSDRPILEPGVILYPHSSVIGKCYVRENTVLSPGVHLINTDTPGNCLVFAGKNGRPMFKSITEFYADRYFSRHL